MKDCYHTIFPLLGNFEVDTQIFCPFIVHIYGLSRLLSVSIVRKLKNSRIRSAKTVYSKNASVHFILKKYPLVIMT